MKRIKFEYDPDGMFTFSHLATRPVKIKAGDVIKVTGLGSTRDKTYKVTDSRYGIIRHCFDCPFGCTYTDSDGFEDSDCTASIPDGEYKRYICETDEDDMYFGFIDVCTLMEDL